MKSTKVRLELHAHRLKNVAGTFKGISDPFAIVTVLASDPKDHPMVLGRTEVIKNSLNPRWIASFELNYELSQNTRINVGIWDEIKKDSNKPMGSAMFEVGEVLGARGSTKAKKLRAGGTLFARITPAPTQDFGKLHLSLRGIKLKNVQGPFGKSDPFFEISAKVKSSGGLTWHPVYRSDHMPSDLYPVWPPASLDVGRMCDGDLDKPILVQILDWEKSGKHNPMGSFETSVNGLLACLVKNANGPANTVDTTKAFKARRKDQVCGEIVVTTATLEGYTKKIDDGGAAAYHQSSPPSLQTAANTISAAAAIANLSISSSAPPISALQPLRPPSHTTPAAARSKFVEYLSGGCELELSIAIDFTGSNGDPRQPGTLHYRYPDGELNDYEKAITAVGSIIARYDSDQKFPVYGFGAKFNGVIQHGFQIGETAELDGISSVLQAYQNVFRTGLTMSGPTVFSEVIDFAAATARSAQDQCSRIGKQNYKVLLILTDGAVSDIDQTKRAIYAASDAPLSIVIVGIGKADFAAMQDLDDFLKSDQRGGGRDIVQFVEFAQHAHDRSSLTRATLEEIPDQLVEYFQSKNILPMSPLSGSQVSLDAEDFNAEDVDLPIEFGDDGEIDLSNYDGLTYDDTKYGTLADYSTLTPMAPPSPSAPPLLSPHQKSSPYASSLPTALPAVPYGAAPVAAQVVVPRVFLVQVPPNVAAGMALQVTNPVTQEVIVVAVPPGAVAGSTFPVPY